LAFATAHRVPSQRSINKKSVFEPTAKQFVAEVHATPLSELLTPPETLRGSGVGTTLQLVPFQRSASV
jgi:hypothetical protein